MEEKKHRHKHPAAAIEPGRPENAAEAGALIRDTDMAEKLMQRITESILEEAGMSMLAQANVNSESVIWLLQDVFVMI